MIIKLNNSNDKVIIEKISSVISELKLDNVKVAFDIVPDKTGIWLDMLSHEVIRVLTHGDTHVLGEIVIESLAHIKITRIDGKSRICNIQSSNKDLRKSLEAKFQKHSYKRKRSVRLTEKQTNLAKLVIVRQ